VSFFIEATRTNGQFHPGEKRLLTYAGELDNLPRNALLDIQQLCCFSGRMDGQVAAHLEQMLERLDEKMTEFGLVV
jgi:hypothetical protein